MALGVDRCIIRRNSHPFCTYDKIIGTSNTPVNSVRFRSAGQRQPVWSCSAEMFISHYFPTDYEDGRTKFRAAAEKANADLHVYGANVRGPEGNAVTTDVALIGQKDAPYVLLCNSATHGVEGFCGSGIFSGFLDSGETQILPRKIRLVFIHALNCHGYAWLRRVTEENVDLNRNFIDHNQPPPRNTEYSKLHPFILPDVWDARTISKSTEELESYASKTSTFKLQSVLTGGQYDHPDGIFYGGRKPTKSHRRFMEIVENHVVGAEHILFLDWHTGLGPYGTGELIGMTRPGSHHGDRVNNWFSHGLEAPSEGQSPSAPLTGTIGSGLRRFFAETETEITSLTVEFGTYPVRDVLMPLIADNWLHAKGNLESDQGRSIKKQIRKALFPDEADWKELVWVRGRQILRRGIRGLATLE